MGSSDRYSSIFDVWDFNRFNFVSSVLPRTPQRNSQKTRNRGDLCNIGRSFVGSIRELSVLVYLSRPDHVHLPVELHARPESSTFLSSGNGALHYWSFNLRNLDRQFSVATRLARNARTARDTRLAYYTVNRRL